MGDLIDNLKRVAGGISGEPLEPPEASDSDPVRRRWVQAPDAEAIVASAPDPVFVSDLAGKILQANHAVFELLGFRPDELVKTSASRLMSPEERREFMAALEEV